MKTEELEKTRRFLISELDNGNLYSVTEQRETLARIEEITEQLVKGNEMTENIWGAEKLIQTDHLTEEQWDLLEEIFKDFK